jgi:hypothetical protein
MLMFLQPPHRFSYLSAWPIKISRDIYRPTVARPNFLKNLHNGGEPNNTLSATPNSLEYNQQKH